MWIRVVAALLTAWAIAGSSSRHARAQEPAPEPLFLPLVLRAAAAPFAAPGTAVPTAHTSTATAAPTTAVSPSPEPSPTDGPTPTVTDAPTPSASPTLAPTPMPTSTGPAWLVRLNMHRALAHLAPVTENAEWGRGGELHSRYMVKNDVLTHAEAQANRWYTVEGNAAGENGNVQIGTNIDRSVDDAVDFWMTEPFHQVAMIDPRLAVSGYGEWREAVGTFHFGATLDVARGRFPDTGSTRFPVRYPEMDTVLPMRSYDGNEVPDPLTSCTGYTAPTGPPLVLMLGAGNVTPRVTAITFTDEAGSVLPSCWFDQTNYHNASRAAEDTGRAVLMLRSAVIVMPRAPLAFDARYTVRIVNDGTTHAWSFRTAPDTTPPFTPMPPVDRDKEDEIVRLINERRAQAGLPAYDLNPRLTHAARRHSRDMAAKDIAGHTGSDGSTPEDRLRDTGYGDCVLSADYATGWGGLPSAVVDYWMSVPSTRAHILSDKREVGIGYAVNPQTTMVHYWYVYYATRK